MTTFITKIISRYCCLSSKPCQVKGILTLIDAFAWCAVVSTETLIDLFIHSPNWGACCPVGIAAPFVEINHETGAMQYEQIN